MVIKKQIKGREVNITLSPENEEENMILYSLNIHYKLGIEEYKTIPVYGGATIKDNSHTINTLTLKYNMF